MRKLIIFLGLLLNVNLYAQQPIIDSVKHLIVVTELQDTMALINNDDINKINKVFYEKDVLDSLNVVNDTLIRKLNLVRIEQDIIIKNQKAVIKNDSLIKLQYRSAIDYKDQTILNNQKEIKKQKTQKTVWQSTTGALALALIIILCI